MAVEATRFESCWSISNTSFNKFKIPSPGMRQICRLYFNYSLGQQLAPCLSHIPIYSSDQISPFGVTRSWSHISEISTTIGRLHFDLLISVGQGQSCLYTLLLVHIQPRMLKKIIPTYIYCFFPRCPAPDQYLQVCPSRLIGQFHSWF